MNSPADNTKPAGIAENDPGPGDGRGAPPVWLVAVVVVVVFSVVILHLTGVIGG